MLHVSRQTSSDQAPRSKSNTVSLIERRIASHLPVTHNVPHNYVNALSLAIHKAGLKAELTPDNEHDLRMMLLDFWIDRRNRLNKTHKHTALNTDLSGGCKLVSQVCYAVFPLAGTVFYNRRHSFVLLHSGDVYDMNRNCLDVLNMHQRGKDPYEINMQVFTSESMVRSLATWNNRVFELACRFLQDRKPRKVDSESWVIEAPKWIKTARN